MRLRPIAECNAPRHLCGWVNEYENWKEARRAAVAHNKATGHVVRVELVETELIGYKDTAEPAEVKDG